jgi:hypothetical protein
MRERCKEGRNSNDVKENAKVQRAVLSSFLFLGHASNFLLSPDGASNFHLSQLDKSRQQRLQKMTSSALAKSERGKLTAQHENGKQSIWGNCDATMCTTL